MPKILYIHPVWVNEKETPGALDTFRKAADEVRRPDTNIDYVSLESGPQNLEYHYYEHQVSDQVLRKVMAAEKDGYDAVIIGCFYDTVLREAREIANIPVIGPAEASMHIAATLGYKFSIIVGSKKWIPKMESNAITYGFGSRIASWKSVGMTVIDFLKEPKRMRDSVAEKAREAIERDNAEVVIQGCTCESGFMKELVRELRIPILDSVVCSVKWAEMAADLYRKLGLSHSKVYGYEPPPELRIHKITVKV